MGINLSGPADYSSEWPFVDIMKYAREWGTQNIQWYGGGQNIWNTELTHEVDFDEQGYPLEMPFESNSPLADTSQCVFTVWANTSALPGGTYVLLYEGEGRLRLWGDATVIQEVPGRLEVAVTPGDADIMALYILESQLDNPIRNIRFLLPGTEFTYLTQPFTQSWLDQLQPFSKLRFMDWGHTNNSPLQHWDQRAQVDNYTYTTPAGIPYEWWIRICNQKMADPWICIPHRADSTYIANMARLFRDSLHQDLTIHVEYTNEYWNWLFDQAHYVHDSLDQDLPWPERYAPRLAEVMQIWTTAFSGQEHRIQRVFASQHAWPDLGWRVLDQLETDGQLPLIDVVSPAGYMSVDHDQLAQLGADASPEQVIQGAQAYTFHPDNYAMTGWKAHADMAATYDLALAFYEGGQHFTPDPWGTVQPYNEAMQEAQVHPQMYDLYQSLFDTLNQLSDKDMLFMHFSFIASIFDDPNQGAYGNFGILEHQFDQMPPFGIEEAPKWRALSDYMEGCSTVTRNEMAPPLPTLPGRVFPNPARSQFFWEPEKATSQDNTWTFTLLTSQGKTIWSETVEGSVTRRSWNTNTLPEGYYLLQVVSGDQSGYFPVIIVQ